jgi:hypothetical protein
LTPSPISLPELSATYNGPQSQYLRFAKEDSTMAVVSPDGCNCMDGYTIAVPNVLDPYTGQIGYGCQLTAIGLAELANGGNNAINTYYTNRFQGNTPCFD